MHSTEQATRCVCMCVRVSLVIFSSSRLNQAYFHLFSLWKEICTIYKMHYKHIRNKFGLFLFCFERVYVFTRFLHSLRKRKLFSYCHVCMCIVMTNIKTESVSWRAHKIKCNSHACCTWVCFGILSWMEKIPLLKMPFGKCATASKTNAAQVEQNKINIAFERIHSRSMFAFHWKSILMKETLSFLHRKKWKNKKWGKNAIFRCTNLPSQYEHGWLGFFSCLNRFGLIMMGEKVQRQTKLFKESLERKKRRCGDWKCRFLDASLSEVQNCLLPPKLFFFVRSWKKVLEIPWICWFAFGGIAHSNLSVWMKCVSRWSLLCKRLKCLVKFNTSQIPRVFFSISIQPSSWKKCIRNGFLPISLALFCQNIQSTGISKRSHYVRLLSICVTMIPLNLLLVSEKMLFRVCPLIRNQHTCITNKHICSNWLHMQNNEIYDFNSHGFQPKLRLRNRNSFAIQ